MQSFIAETGNFTGTTVTITGEEYHHATLSCRVKTGELIGVTDGRGKRDKDNKDEVQCCIILPPGMDNGSQSEG